MSRMFKTISRTVNAQTGCHHDCTYCWAADRARRMKEHPKYRNGFVSVFTPAVLERQKYHSGESIFFSAMGDLMGEWVPAWVIQRHIDEAWNNPETTFLFQTKNPDRFHEFHFPINCVLGTTLESNRDWGVSKAPPPAERAAAMEKIVGNRKFLSIEPIMDFDRMYFVPMIEQVTPGVIEIGADNYNKGLPEPSVHAVQTLLKYMVNLRYPVLTKDSLDRITGGDHKWIVRKQEELGILPESKR